MRRTEASRAEPALAVDPSRSTPETLVSESPTARLARVRPDISALIEESCNGSFDCGDYRGDGDEPYRVLHARAGIAHAALATAILALVEEREAAGTGFLLALWMRGFNAAQGKPWSASDKAWAESEIAIRLSRRTAIKGTDDEAAVPRELLCLVCAYVKPWGIRDDRTGVAVCIDCRDKARAATPSAGGDNGR
jgi:hypothetical protein